MKIMSRKVISTHQAPGAIGPYSQAIVVDNKFVYTSGQIPLTPEGTKVEGSIEDQTHQVMNNLMAVLEAANSDFNHVVKTTIFLSDMSLFQQMNAVYGSYFVIDPPARSTVAVKGLPMGVDIEIEVVALVKD